MVDKLITAAVSLRNKIASIHSRVVEKYVPLFSKSAGMVACFPLYDKNLTISTTVTGGPHTSAKLVICGKNLYNASEYNLESGAITYGTGVYGPSSTYAATKAYIPVSHLRGRTLTLNHPPYEYNINTNVGVAFYTDKSENTRIVGSGTTRQTITVPDNASYMRFSVPKAYATSDAAQCEVQIEIGTIITPYEMYKGSVIEKRFDEGISGGEIVWNIDESFLGGTVNNIYSDVGETTVSGRTDPAKTLRAANEFLQID